MTTEQEFLDGTRVLGPKGGRKAELTVMGSHAAWQEYWDERAQLSAAEKDMLSKLAHHVNNAAFHEAQIVNVVIKARAAGLSWQWIADELGTTKQAAQQKYSRFLPKL